jgi:hypothetical protein
MKKTTFLAKTGLFSCFYYKMSVYGPGSPLVKMQIKSMKEMSNFEHGKFCLKKLKNSQF